MKILKVLKETQNYNVLYCNNIFLDVGASFMENQNIKQEEVLSILKNIFQAI